MNGTYSRNGYIYASIAGTVNFVKQEDNTVCQLSLNLSQYLNFYFKKTIEVVSVGRNHHLVPQMGSIVTCRVLSISSNVVRLNIHCIGEEVLKQPFKGLLRKQDIRDFDKEKVQISQCFRPSDIILAKVIGLGENHSFLVTTADNELGVVVALNQSGISSNDVKSYATVSNLIYC